VRSLPEQIPKPQAAAREKRGLGMASEILYGKTAEAWTSLSKHNRGLQDRMVVPGTVQFSSQCASQIPLHQRTYLADQIHVSNCAE
jgi:hypothetical protein